MEIFMCVPTNHPVKEFWRSVHICQIYCQTPMGILYWDTVYLHSWYCQSLSKRVL